MARSSRRTGSQEGEALDWRGQPLSCSDCPHKEIRSEKSCDLGRICVRDRRARRIDRFFAANPGEAENYLTHPYFEARALAAKYAHVFVLAPLVDDPEPDVRAMVARRLPANRRGTPCRRLPPSTVERGPVDPCACLP